MRITPFLWFDDQAEEAVELYSSIFPRSRVTHVSRYGPDAAERTGRPVGSVMVIAFELNGQPFTALNGGPHFTFNEAISLSVDCESQEEIDHYWERLSDGGEPGPCGWLKDRFGVSWQIVPAALADLMDDSDPERAQRVARALLEMGKLEIAGLRAAYDG
jgi:predicted 3-demethylubiquinone-9 3-methyltransferase (glyoxalase superfamily)